MIRNYQYRYKQWKRDTNPQNVISKTLLRDGCWGGGGGGGHAQGRSPWNTTALTNAN